MKLRLEESFDGEFSGLSNEEFAQKLERAFDGARSACSLSKGGTPENDGAVEVIKDLSKVMTSHYKKRLNQLRKEIVTAVRDSV